MPGLTGAGKNWVKPKQVSLNNMQLQSAIPLNIEKMKAWPLMDQLIHSIGSGVLGQHDYFQFTQDTKCATWAA